MAYTRRRSRSRTAGTRKRSYSRSGTARRKSGVRRSTRGRAQTLRIVIEQPPMSGVARPDFAVQSVTAKRAKF